MRGPNSLRVSTIAPRTSGRRRVDCAPANLRKTIEIVPDEGATIPDPDPFPIMRGDLMELMQTGRRRWGRPTRVRSPYQGTGAAMHSRSARSARCPGARNVRDSEAYSRRPPGTSPGTSFRGVTPSKFGRPTRFGSSSGIGLPSRRFPGSARRTNLNYSVHPPPG